MSFHEVGLEADALEKNTAAGAAWRVSAARRTASKGSRMRRHDRRAARDATRWMMQVALAPSAPEDEAGCPGCKSCVEAEAVAVVAGREHSDWTRARQACPK